MRTYVCPVCSYDGFETGNVVKSPVDVNVMWGCPMCSTLHGRTVWLVETSDPRTLALEDDAA